MRPWERRLKDLSIIYSNCENNYFNPELFRLNLNNFLQISRTVTFVIQKNKESIPGFSDWYPNIQKNWSSDPILVWAKDSRNTIEKEGDLELNSSITADLIYSYFKEDDRSIEISKQEYLFGALSKLIHYLKKYGRDLENEEWVIRVERKWIANTLPDFELLYTMNYIYSRQYNLCKDISALFGSEIDSTIQSPQQHHLLISDSKKARYFDGFNVFPGELKYFSIEKDNNFEITPLLEKHRQRWTDGSSFETFFDSITQNAKELFEKDGYHIPMVFIFDKNNRIIELTPLSYDKRYKKFIVWRDLAERISYMSFEYMFFVSEAWLKNKPNGLITSITKLENIGELLTIEALKRDGFYEARNFQVIRIDSKVTLGHEGLYEMTTIPEYFNLILRNIK